MGVIPYGRHLIDDDDCASVLEALRSDWLTTGERVDRFEQAVSKVAGSRYGVAVSSGTAALHTAMFGAGIQEGDEVILPPMTFVATANAIVFQGGKPVFCDVQNDSLLIDPKSVEQRITDRTKAIVAVDYAGQPCDYEELQSICARHNLVLISDACHSLGADYKEKPVGSLADLTVFSFHAVKLITTAEGGMIVTHNCEISERMRRFRNHGISADLHRRKQQETWFYEAQDLGFNYRLSDIQCALGLSQLKKLRLWIKRRQAIAAHYDSAFAGHQALSPLSLHSDRSHAHHLYVIKIDPEITPPRRFAFFKALRALGIGVNVHYIPVHLHPYYRQKYETSPGLCPVAERAYEHILTLPMHPGMNAEDVSFIISAVLDVESKGILD